MYTSLTVQDTPPEPTEQINSAPPCEPAKASSVGIVIGIVLGVGIGMAIGGPFGYFGLGTSLGGTFGLVFGIVFATRNQGAD